MANFEAQRFEPMPAGPLLGKCQGFGSDPAAAPCFVNEQFVQQRVAAMKFQAVPDGEDEVADGIAIHVQEPSPSVLGTGNQAFERFALPVSVVTARFVELRHVAQHPIDARRTQRNECYSQVSMIGEPARRIPHMLWIAVPLAYLLYFFRLDAVGMLGPDEPRYASIAREMARSGDWITPRLWGSPWFEKPPLLYWMSGTAFRLGLGPDLAPRAPVALLATAFLI